MTTKITQNRPIYSIAQEINQDWKKINYAAKPYLNAMEQLDRIDENYFYDSAKTIILYFLCNAGQWRGEVARRVKKELKDLTTIAK